MIEKHTVTIDADKLPVVIPDEGDFEAAEFLDAPALREIGKNLISERAEFAHLAQTKLIYLWKKTGGKSHGKLTLGKVQLASGLVHFFSEADFVVSLSADHLREYGEVPGLLPIKFAEALVYHELCHLGWDAEKGEVVMRAHDFEGFIKEIETYQLWRAELAELRQTMKQVNLL